MFFFSSRRRHTRCSRDWSSDVCSSDLKRGCDGPPNSPGRTCHQRGLALKCSHHPQPSIRPSSLRSCITLDPTADPSVGRSEEHTSELQSRLHLVCRLLLEKKKNYNINH